MAAHVRERALRPRGSRRRSRSPSAAARGDSRPACPRRLSTMPARGAARARMFSRKLSGMPVRLRDLLGRHRVVAPPRARSRRGRRSRLSRSCAPPDYARPMAELPLTGGCLCGGVRYEIDGAARLRRLLPLHALPAPDRHGRLGAGAASCRARCGSSRARSSSGSGSRRARLREVLLLRLRRRALESAPATARSGASGSARSTPIRASVRRTGTFVAYAAPWEPIPDDGAAAVPRGARALKLTAGRMHGRAAGRSQRSSRTSSGLGQADAAGGRAAAC